MNILLPLDGSQESLAALPWLRIIAQPKEDKVEVFRAYWSLEELRSAAGYSINLSGLADPEELESEIVEEMKEQVLDLDDLEPDFVAKAGSPIRAILERTKGKDLVLLASRGNTGLKKLLLGSLATQLVRASETSLMIINASKEPVAKPQVKKIMVPLDGSERAETALELAGNLAQRLGATVVLYQAVVRQWRTSEGSTRFLDEAKEYLENIGAKLGEKGIETEVLVATSVDRPKIVQQSKVAEADLLVMTSHGRSGVARWVLGSVAENVIQRSECPVALVYARPD